MIGYEIEAALDSDLTPKLVRPSAQKDQNWMVQISETS